METNQRRGASEEAKAESGGAGCGAGNGVREASDRCVPQALHAFRSTLLAFFLVAAFCSVSAAERSVAFRKPAAELSDTRAFSDIFSNTPTERITLQRAIEMALRNNLEVQFERTGIRVEQARVRFAAGVFDPVFSVQTSQQQIRRAEDVSNPRSAQAIQQQVSFQNQLVAASQQLAADQITSQQQSIVQGQLVQAQLQNQVEQINFQRAVNGLPPIVFNPVEVQNLPSLQQTVQQPQFNDVIVLNQRSTQAVASFQGRTPIGTRYSFEASVNRSVNTFEGDPDRPTALYESFLGLTVQQPLLRNFGTDANLSDLRVARINKRIQVLDWKQNIASAIQGVMAAYYDMLSALQDVRVREDAIAADTKLVELSRRRVEVGFASPIDTSQAEVAVSTDQESLLLSKNTFLERQFSLKRLILEEFQVKDPRIFIPENAPQLPIPQIDRSAFLSTAFRERYDYLSALLSAEAQDVRLRFAKNQLLPQLDLTASYGLNGLARDFGGTFDEAFGGQTPTYSVGLNFQVPLGNVQGRAQFQAALGLREQALLRVKQSEVTVGTDVDTVIARIETNRQRVEASRKTRELGEQAVRIAYRRLEEGLISAFDVIEQQRKLYDAKSRELASQAELNKSVTQLWLVTGTVLERQGVGFRESAEVTKLPWPLHHWNDPNRGRPGTPVPNERPAGAKLATDKAKR